MNYYPKIGTKVRITRLSDKHNGKVGEVIDRDGKYIAVSIKLGDSSQQVEVYPCEIEEVVG